MEHTIEIHKKLNTLLATYQIHYQNLRGLHWNIKGENFFELHTKYEELYLRVQDIIDEIAERMLSLEVQPLHRYVDYLNNSKIEELNTTSIGSEGMKYIVEAQKVILAQENEILQLASDANDEGSSALMSDLIREKEKSTWMFNAWLNKK